MTQDLQNSPSMPLQATETSSMPTQQEHDRPEEPALYVNKQNVVFWKSRWGWHIAPKQAYIKLKQAYKEIWHVFLTLTRDLNRQERDQRKEPQNRTYIPIPFDEETQALIDKWATDDQSCDTWFPQYSTRKDESGQKEKLLGVVLNKAQMSKEAEEIVHAVQFARLLFAEQSPEIESIQDFGHVKYLQDYTRKHFPEAF